jgi:hypothetical protein
MIPHHSYDLDSCCEHFKIHYKTLREQNAHGLLTDTYLIAKLYSSQYHAYFADVLLLVTLPSSQSSTPQTIQENQPAASPKQTNSIPQSKPRTFVLPPRSVKPPQANKQIFPPLQSTNSATVKAQKASAPPIVKEQQANAPTPIAQQLPELEGISEDERTSMVLFYQNCTVNQLNSFFNKSRSKVLNSDIF